MNHQFAVDALEANDTLAAYEACESLLERNPNDAIALNLMGYAYLLMGKEQIAYQYLQRSIDVQPSPANLTNFGKCLCEMGREAESIQWFMRAAEMAPDMAGPYANASAALVRMSEWSNGKKAAELALEANPDDENARVNLAHCQLALGDFKAGFDNFDLALGGQFRKEWAYGDEGRWDGEYVQTLVIYGEQGLGDEIFYAAWINDAISKVGKVIIDCDPKLENLFRRSFPKADVYGTRRDESPEWLENYTIDARCAMGSLPRFCERQMTPYLVACPEKRLMWRALFRSWVNPVMGVALSGGTKKNNAVGRKIDVAYFDVFKARGAELVSLEYKGSDNGLKAFPMASRSADYDDTCAMIAEMDSVVGICTTALHAADALGVETWTLVPTYHNWRFHLPTMENQHFVMQDGRAWKDVMQEVGNGLVI